MLPPKFNEGPQYSCFFTIGNTVGVFNNFSWTRNAFQIAYASATQEALEVFVFDDHYGWLSVRMSQSIDLNTLHNRYMMRCTALVNTKSTALICLSFDDASLVPHEDRIACSKLQIRPATHFKSTSTRFSATTTSVAVLKAAKHLRTHLQRVDTTSHCMYTKVNNTSQAKQIFPSRSSVYSGRQR